MLRGLFQGNLDATEETLLWFCTAANLATRITQSLLDNGSFIGAYQCDYLKFINFKDLYSDNCNIMLAMFVG